MSNSLLPPKIPPSLAGTPPYCWTADEIMTFVKTNAGGACNAKDLELFRALGVAGPAFLAISADTLKVNGISPSAALGLESLARLLGASLVPAPIAEKRAGSPLTKLSPEEEEEKKRQDETRKTLEITVGNLEKLDPGELSARNNITVRADLPTGTNFLTSSSPDWPDYVQKFHDLIIAPAKYPVNTQDEDIQVQVGTLKRHLGSEAFDAQFTPARPGATGMTARQLLTYTTAVMEAEDFCYHHDFSAVAKEVNLAGLVVDPAIKHLGGAYNRGTVRAKILVAGNDKPWCPKSDFSVAYGTDPGTYSLFLGETDSGEAEQDAMCKNALLSCYSWKLYRFLTKGKQQEHVILSAYISMHTSSLYMFYKDRETFVIQSILKISDMFRNKAHVVQFLRRMHNFAANIQWKSSYGELALDPSMGTLFISSLPTQAKTNPTGSKKQKSGATATPQNSGAKASSNTMHRTDLNGTGFEYYGMFKHGHIASVRDLDSGGKWIAKKIQDRQELHTIKFLLAARSMKYWNHTIDLKATFNLENDGALLIMPHHVDLSMLTHLDESSYYNLRFQLIEGVAFMHEQGVAHRDLKPSNLVVESKTSPHGKLFIIDYDLAKQYAVGETCVGYRGTEGWTAPEVKDEAEWYPMPADVWSMAQVIVGLAKLAGCSYGDIELALSNEPSLRPTAAQLHTGVSPVLPPIPVAAKEYHHPTLKRRLSKLV